jgi:hypothetical protein
VVALTRTRSAQRFAIGRLPLVVSHPFSSCRITNLPQAESDPAPVGICISETQLRGSAPVALRYRRIEDRTGLGIRFEAGNIRPSRESARHATHAANSKQTSSAGPGLRNTNSLTNHFETQPLAPTAPAMEYSETVVSPWHASNACPWGERLPLRCSWGPLISTASQSDIRGLPCPCAGHRSILVGLRNIPQLGVLAPETPRLLVSVAAP